MAIKRLRFRPRPKSAKNKLSSEEWEQIKDEAAAAKAILKGKEYQFLRDYLKKSQDHVLKTFAVHSIEDAWIDDYQTTQTPQGSVIERVKRVFFPAKKEYSHLSGEYKFIERLLGDLTTISELPDKARKEVEAGTLEIEESKE